MKEVKRVKSSIGVQAPRRGSASLFNRSQKALAVSFGIVALGVAALPAQLSAGIVFDNGFEAGAADWGASGDWVPKPSDATSSPIGREGGKSVRFIHLSKEIDPDMGTNERSEFVIKGDQGRYDWGTEYWEGFSMRVIRPNGNFGIVFQHHATPHDWTANGGGNSFTIKTNGEKFEVYTQTNPAMVNALNPKSATFGAKMVSTPYVLDRWYDFVIHFKLATDNTGIMQVWIKDTVTGVKTQLVNVTAGVTVYKYDGSNVPKTPINYQKIGLYYGKDGGFDVAGEVLYDAFRIWEGAGGSYESVAPRGGSNGNTAPVAKAQSVTTAEDASKAITLAGSDADGNALTYTVVSNPAHGTLSGSGAARTYAPAANYSGSDSFTFKVNDGTVDSAVATVSMTVTAVNDVPVATAQSVSTPKNTSKSITLSGTDIEGSALTYAIVSQPSHGALSGTGASRTYTPTTGYTGSDSFTFTANDGTAASAAGTVSITVTAVNAAPVAKAQSMTTAEDTAKAVTLSATDADGDALTYSIVTQPLHGSLSGTMPNLTYTPALNYNGTDSFTFRANDGQAYSNTATVSISITAVNDAPVAKAQSVKTAEDTAKAVTLTSSDIENNARTYSIVSQPVHGTLSGTGAARTYKPAANYYGADSFTFKVNDGNLDSNTAAVSITVTTVNDKPVAVLASPARGMTFAAPAVITLTANATDPDGAADIAKVEFFRGGSTLIGTSTASPYSITWNGVSAGTYSLTAKVTDKAGATATSAAAGITVRANSAPVAKAQSVTTAEDASKAITLSATDTDGDVLTYAILANPLHGTAALSGAVATYAPAANYNGSDSFTFRATDSRGAVSNTATVSITVTAVNDKPVVTVTSSAYLIDLSQVKQVTVTAAAADADNDAITYVWSKVSGPGSAKFAVPNGKTGAASFLTAGTYQLKVTVSDGKASSDGFVEIKVSDPALVAWYDFEEVSGANVPDVSGKGLDGAISGGVIPNAAGIKGRALEFNGTSGMVTVQDNPSLDLTGAMTLEAWVKPESMAADDWHVALIKEGGATGMAYSLYASTDIDNPGALINTGRHDQWTDGVSQIPMSAWTHLAATYDGSVLRLYVNGDMVSEKSMSGSIVSTSGALCIGGDTVWGEFFDGLIDEVRVYDRALSAGEIADAAGQN